MSKAILAILAAALVIMAGAFVYFYTTSDSVEAAVQKVASKDTRARRSSVTQTQDREWEPVRERAVVVANEKTGQPEEVTLNAYLDPNFDFVIAIPDTYGYEVSDSAVLFTSDARDMFYSAEVILTKNNGGVFEELDQVRDNYLSQLQDYGPSIYKESERMIDNKKVLDFAVKYELTGYGMYMNRFIVGRDDRYFYVLQFNTRAVEYENDVELIDEIIKDYQFGSY